MRRPNPEKEHEVERLFALIGFVLILAIAFALSNNRQAIRWRTVLWNRSTLPREGES